MTTDLVFGNSGSPIELAIYAWLDAKQRISGSINTAKVYYRVLDSFRAFLKPRLMDLDSDPDALALLAQAWLSQQTLAGTSYNQHLAVLSSFYKFARKQRLLVMENPIERVERARVHRYAGALPLDARDVRRQLTVIDRTTLAGARDYALLAMGLQTGRRVSELAALRLGDIQRVGEQAHVHWRRTKGGKSMRDKLPAAVTAVLYTWLHRFYGAGFAGQPVTTPLWVSLSSNGTRGKPLNVQSIADICQRRLGVSKVHTLRHTFARTMEDAGAKVSDIQARLGHESLDTTGRYLAALNRAENPQMDKLSDLFGFGTELSGDG